MRKLMLAFLLATGVMVSGCAEDPGSMSKAEVEAKLKDTLKLKSITLTETPEGEFTGTGDKEDGSTLKLTVTQKKVDRSLWYSAVDQNGKLEAGGFKNFSAGGIDPGALQRWSLILKVGLVVALIAAAVGSYAFSRKRRIGQSSPDAKSHGGSNPAVRQNDSHKE